MSKAKVRRRPAPEQRLLDPCEAAEYLGTTERWMRRAVAHDYLPYVKMGPRLVRFDLADLDAYIAAQRHTPTRRA